MVILQLLKNIKFDIKCYIIYMPKIIQTNKNVLGGMPVIRGTRIPIARVLALVGMNYTLKDIQYEYPKLLKLTKKQLEEILTYYKNNLN